MTICEGVCFEILAIFRVPVDPEERTVEVGAKDVIMGRPRPIRHFG